jgi:hypothetical protein
LKISTENLKFEKGAPPREIICDLFRGIATIIIIICWDGQWREASLGATSSRLTI